MKSRHSIFKSFSFAFEGLRTALLRGRNFRIQFALGFLAVILGFAVRLDAPRWAILAATISSVLILELINTALESIVDIVSPEIREEAKTAKDMAAASVLIAAAASLAIGVFLFYPLFSNWF